MAVCAQMVYDNSDSMSDYFDRHCSIGPVFVLAVGKSGREMEARARKAVALYPELSAIEFEWKTEKWSMGHGNYLDSSTGIALTPEMTGGRDIYRGGQLTHGRWEIVFRAPYKDSQPFIMPAFKGYGVTTAPPAVAAPVQAVESPATAAPVLVRRNTEKNGIEIVFAAKPEPTILEKLKAAGWRWSRFAACWYIRASAEAEKFAAEIAGMNGGLTAN